MWRTYKIATLTRVLVLLLLLIGLGEAVYVWLTSDRSLAYAAARDRVFVVREMSPEASHHIVEQPVMALAGDPKLALITNHYTVFAEDRVSTDAPGLGATGGVIRLERAPIVHLTDGKRKSDIHSWAATVEGALAEHHIPEVGQDDKVSPSLSATVTHDMQVTIVRVQETDVIEKQTIAFTTIEKTDANLERGKSRVDQEGHAGAKQLTYHVRREDGVEVYRKLTQTEIPTPKQDRVVTKGTKLLIGRILQGNASWYKSAYQAASNVFKRGTNVRVTNTATGKSLEVKIDDFMEGTDKVIDLHPTLFTQLGASLSQGIQSVRVEEVLN